MPQQRIEVRVRLAGNDACHTSRALRERRNAAGHFSQFQAFNHRNGGMMSTGLSRRAVLRAFVPASPEETLVRIAAIGSACVEPKGVSCRRCGEVCDENAIRFVPLPGGRAAAVLNTAMCSGCGECLAPCPVSAITLIARDTAVLAREVAQLEARP